MDIYRCMGVGHILVQYRHTLKNTILKNYKILNVKYMHRKNNYEFQNI